MAATEKQLFSVSSQKNVKRLTKDTFFTVSLIYNKVVFHVIGAVTKPEILIGLN
jgi:hypothetical protein